MFQNCFSSSGLFIHNTGSELSPSSLVTLPEIFLGNLTAVLVIKKRIFFNREQPPKRQTKLIFNFLLAKFAFITFSNYKIIQVFAKYRCNVIVLLLILTFNFSGEKSHFNAFPCFSKNISPSQLLKHAEHNRKTTLYFEIIKCYVVFDSQCFQHLIAFGKIDLLFMCMTWRF